MRSFILSLVFCILIPACGNDSNHAPVANAGPDQNIATGSVVTLDAGDSSDTDGDSITYAWSFESLPEGSSAALSDATAVRPTFTADLDGNYEFQLIVSDGNHESDPDSVTVNASTVNSAPVADAGSDRNVATGSLVTLDASASSDADGDSFTYSWSLISIPEGSDATLSDASTAAPRFTADLDGDYLIQVIVHDDAADSSPDTVTVTASTANSAPVANAGADRNVATGSLVTLDAGASSDADGDSLTYSWSLINAPDGSGAELSDPDNAQPTFTPDLDGDYVIQLIVHDDAAGSSPDTVTVTASTANSAPVANAGADRNVVTGSLVTLDAGASSDADGDSLTYSWSLINAPDGSGAELSDPADAQPTFTPDLHGDYLIQLIVHDGAAESNPDSVLITSVSTLWSPIELVVSAAEVAEIPGYLTNPVPVRFDANTLHLYFAGVSGTVVNRVFRITSDDNGQNWSTPERMAQLEGNYQTWPTGYFSGKLLIVWHNGIHSELYDTDLGSPSVVPAAPSKYVDFSTISREVTWFSQLSGSMIGMWHPASTANYTPFIGLIEPETAILSGIDWPFGGTYYFATPVSANKAVVQTDQGLLLAGFDGTSFSEPATPLPFPSEDDNFDYNGTTFHHAQLDPESGYIYFTGYSASGSAVYRVKLLQ